MIVAYQALQVKPQNPRVGGKERETRLDTRKIGGGGIPLSLKEKDDQLERAIPRVHGHVSSNVAGGSGCKSTGTTILYHHSRRYRDHAQAHPSWKCGKP